MGLSIPMYDSPYIIALQPVKKLIGINSMIIRSPWYDYDDIIALEPLKKC